MTTLTPGEVLKKYLEIRARTEAMKARHKDELAPWLKAMAGIETHLLRIMDAQQLDNLRAVGVGTAYRASRANVSVADWETFREFVVDKEAWHLLTRRAATTAVEDFLESEGALPPGLDLSRSIYVNIRKE